MNRLFFSAFLLYSNHRHLYALNLLQSNFLLPLLLRLSFFLFLFLSLSLFLSTRIFLDVTCVKERAKYRQLFEFAVFVFVLFSFSLSHSFSATLSLTYIENTITPAKKNFPASPTSTSSPSTESPDSFVPPSPPIKIGRCAYSLSASLINPLLFLRSREV